MTLIDGNHYDARPGARERQVIRLWIDTGATSAATYAAQGTGMIGTSRSSIAPSVSIVPICSGPAPRLLTPNGFRRCDVKIEKSRF